MKKLLNLWLIRLNKWLEGKPQIKYLSGKEKL